MFLSIFASGIPYLSESKREYSRKEKTLGKEETNITMNMIRDTIYARITSSNYHLSSISPI